MLVKVQPRTQAGLPLGAYLGIWPVGTQSRREGGLGMNGWVDRWMDRWMDRWKKEETQGAGQEEGEGRQLSTYPVPDVCRVFDIRYFM